MYADLKAAADHPGAAAAAEGNWLISAAALLHRAHDLAVISESSYRRISAQISALGWRTGEPDPLPAEQPAVVPALVRRAIGAAGGIEAAAAAAGTTAAVIRRWPARRRLAPGQGKTS